MPSSVEILSEQGLLQKVIPGFVIRPSQQKMAEIIERIIHLKSELIIEAGTGTGKTFAYLIPTFLAQKKTIISTGTKNLQDQLFLKDIPIIKKIISTPIKIVLLKGRVNYLCLYRLKKNREEGRFTGRNIISEFQEIEEWSKLTKTGDIAELNQISEDSTVWPYVTSTADNCLNQDCEFYNKCFVGKARQEALAADIVVVNHHLFFADMALQEDGFGELLPGADVVIFDEAHHLPDVASHFFSEFLTSRQLIELARDVDNESALNAKEIKEMANFTSELQTAVHEMRIALGSELKRVNWPEKPSNTLKNAIIHIKISLQKLEEILKTIMVRSKGLENCWRRTSELIDKFNLLTKEHLEDKIHWLEMHLQSFTLQLTPIVVAEFFKSFMSQKKRAWIFTSATLTVKNSFQLFVDTLGLDRALQLQLKSPFKYDEQTLLYVPRGLPDPRENNYTDKFIEKVIEVLNVSQGKAFLLFTSYKALEKAAALLQETISFPLLLQGAMPKRELIDQFKKLGNAVLLGTSSFWYGVDVRGDALSCVIIDKLPFSAPEDPILQGRIKYLRKKGIDPFQSYQLPQAILMLKQGIGRLIRDDKDRGILMIGDPRLVGNRYGATFLQSLPNCPRTRDLKKVKQFFA